VEVNKSEALAEAGVKCISHQHLDKVVVVSCLITVISCAGYCTEKLVLPDPQVVVTHDRVVMSVTFYGVILNNFHNDSQ